MAEPRIDIDASSAERSLSNLTGQVDQFNLALGRVDQQARRIFANLENLSERQQRLGFLGAGDQRSLETARRQWTQASQVLDYQRRGAEARVAAAQQLSQGTPADIARIRQAYSVAAQLERRQWGMGILEGSLGNLAAPVPSTPLQAAQMAAGLPPTGVMSSGRFSPWPGGAPGGGPPAGGAPGGGGALGRGWGMGLMGALGRGLATLPGIAVGYGAYQAISGGLSELEQRSRGVLEIGSILQGQYESVDRTILGLRDSYQILARDGRAALTTLARATGDVTGLNVGGAMRIGRAYGFEREAAPMLATLATLGGGVPDLATMTGVYNQSVAGRARISLPRFMEAAVGMAGVGGFGARPLAGGEYAQLTANMTLMGGKYAQHPTEAYAEYFAGLQAPASPLGESLRMTAVGTAARHQRFIDIGDMKNIDLSTWTGQRIAMEQAGQSEVMSQAYYREIQRQSQGNEGMAVALTQEMFGIDLVSKGLDRWRNLERTGGRYVAPANVTQESANIDKALADQRAADAQRRGDDLRRGAAGAEKAGEAELIKGLQDVHIEVGKAIGRTVDAWNASHDPIKTATAALDELGKKTAAVAVVMTGAMAALAGSPVLAGIALAGGGAVALEELLRPFALPGSPTERGIGAPSPRDPLRPGP